MSKKYIPERGDIVWLDVEPTEGKEIGKHRPMLTLSSKLYNKHTGLLICCPISTSVRGAATEVTVNNLDEVSVVATTLIQTMDWKSRKVKFIAKAEPAVFQEAILKIIPLIGGDRVINQYLSSD